MDKYFKDLLKTLAVGAGFSSLPFFASLADLQPPWPPAIGQVSAGLVLVSGLFAWEFVRSGVTRNRRVWMLAAASLTIGGLFGYLALYSLFVETIPGSETRMIRGFSCTPAAKVVYSSECPSLTADALADAGWRPEQLWTRSSITLIRLGLAATWLVFTAGLICAVGAAVAGRKGPAKPRKRQAKAQE
jgi:hypothetical protein